MGELIDIAAIESAIASVPDFDKNLESNSTRTLLTFPLTRQQAAEALGVSDVTVGKWVKEIEGCDRAVTKNNRITEEGLNLLRQYQQASDRLGFLESLKPAEIVTVSSLEIDADFEELYSSVRDRYAGLDEAESETIAALATTEAELIAEFEDFQDSRDREMAVSIREAKMRGMHRAMQELTAEEKAYRATIDRFRTEKMGKHGTPPRKS